MRIKFHKPHLAAFFLFFPFMSCVLNAQERVSPFSLVGAHIQPSISLDIVNIAAFPNYKLTLDNRWRTQHPKTDIAFQAIGGYCKWRFDYTVVLQDTSFNEYFYKEKYHFRAQLLALIGHQKGFSFDIGLGVEYLTGIDYGGFKPYNPNAPFDYNQINYSILLPLGLRYQRERSGFIAGLYLTPFYMLKEGISADIKITVGYSFCTNKSSKKNKLHQIEMI